MTEKELSERFEKAMRGTPTTLQEAIVNALEVEMKLKAKEVPLTVKHVRAHVKDYLSQQFQKFQLNSENDEVSMILEKLWERIIRE